MKSALAAGGSRDAAAAAAEAGRGGRAGAYRLEQSPSMESWREIGAGSAEEREG